MSGVARKTSSIFIRVSPEKWLGKNILYLKSGMEEGGERRGEEGKRERWADRRESGE